MLKAFVQGALAALPARAHFNYIAQRYLTRSLETGKKAIQRRLVWAGKHLASFQTYTERDVPTHVLELGTGWFPTVPIALWLSGVDHITTIDIVDLKRVDYFRAVLPVFLSYTHEELVSLLPRLQVDRFTHLRDLAVHPERLNMDETLAAFGIRPLIADAVATQFESASFDLIVSNTTFEHIPRATLAAILREFARLLSADGIMSHLIDISDHYSHFDKSITPYNYLRYDESLWRWFNNAALYQNRLRVSDYRVLHTDAGFTALEQTDTTDHADALLTIVLAHPFLQYTHADLIPTRTWIISSKV